MDWFTSDTHFNHANIIKYCKRPFASVEEMNETLLKNINDRVKPGDRLFHLGDFAKFDVAALRERINCKNIVLILGNHDRIPYNSRVFSAVYDMYTLKTEIDGAPKNIVLCHYALKVWNKSHYGAWHLYGHSHGGLPDDETAQAFDAGVDCHNYAPISIDEVKAIMAKKKWEDPRIKWARDGSLWKPFDHHRPEHKTEEAEWSSDSEL